MTQLLDHPRSSRERTAPTLAPVPPRHLAESSAPRRFYLVGEAERSSRHPVPAGAGRTSISINGRWHGLRGRTATFEQLLRIAYPEAPLHSPGQATVTFRHGVATWPAGALAVGDIIELVDGLVVNADATSAS